MARSEGRGGQPGSSSTLRAVVFDLDDTLFDAFGQCVRPAQREAAAAMRAAGLDAPLEEVVALRESLAGRALDVDGAVAEAFPCAEPARVAAAGRRAFFERDPGRLTPHPFAAAVLAKVRERARCVLLTAGNPKTQRMKVERLGLADAFHEALFVDATEHGGDVGKAKHFALSAWIVKHGLAPETVLVVGDRPSGEIAAALALGCRALRIRQGEWAREATPVGALGADDIRAVLPLL